MRPTRVINNILVAAALLLAGGAAPAPASSAPVDQSAKVSSAASGITVTGKLRIHVRLKASASLPNGTAVTTILSVKANDATFSNTAVASTAPNVTVSSGVADATIEVPYIFQVASLSDTIDVGLSMLASVTSGSTFYNGSRTFTQSIPLPKDGAVTTINLTGGI